MKKGNRKTLHANLGNPKCISRQSKKTTNGEETETNLYRNPRLVLSPSLVFVAVAVCYCCVC